MNCKCGVQSKRKCESHESCVCIIGFTTCGCQKKSVVYETEHRDARSSSERSTRPEPFIALKHMQATSCLIRSEMGSQCSFSPQERCRVGMTGRQESYSKVQNFTRTSLRNDARKLYHRWMISDSVFGETRDFQCLKLSLVFFLFYCVLLFYLRCIG